MHMIIVMAKRTNIQNHGLTFKPKTDSVAVITSFGLRVSSVFFVSYHRSHPRRFWTNIKASVACSFAEL